MLGGLNMADREACILGGDGLYMVCTCFQVFYGAEVLWDLVVLHGASPLSVILIIYVQVCAVGLL